MVVVDAEHVFCAHAEAQAFASELDQSDFEGYLFGDLQTSDEVYPGVAKDSFDPQAICAFTVGETSVVGVLRMRLNHLLFSSTSPRLQSFQLMPQCSDFLILLSEFLIQPLLQQPYLHLISLIPSHFFLTQLDNKPFFLVLKLHSSLRNDQSLRLMGQMVEKLLQCRKMFLKILPLRQFSLGVSGRIHNPSQGIRDLEVEHNRGRIIQFKSYLPPFSFELEVREDVVFLQFHKIMDMLRVSPFDLFPVLVGIVGEGRRWSGLYYYFLVLQLGLVLHYVLEVGCRWTDWSLLALPELASEVLSLQQILVPLQVLRVDIAGSPVHELHLLPHSLYQLLSILNELQHLLLVLQLDELLLHRPFVHLILGLGRSGRRVVQMREGELYEVEVELQLFEECGLIGLGFLVFLEDSRELAVEKWLFVDRRLRDCLFEDGQHTLDVVPETHIDNKAQK